MVQYLNIFFRKTLGNERCCALMKNLFILAISRRDTFARKLSDREDPRVDIFNGHSKKL
jgi:hypothetical protein